MEVVSRVARRIRSMTARAGVVRPPLRASSASRAGPAEHPSHRRVWVLGACALLVAGVVASLFGAGQIARNSTARSRDGFKASSAQIASTLRLAIQHEEDLVVAARAFVVGDADASSGAFRRWTNAVDALKRYPELISISHIVVVPAARLPAFETQAKKNQPGARTFTVVPSGKRPFYCLIAASVASARTSATFAPGMDVCAIDPVATSAGLGARDSGRTAYAPVTFGADHWMLV